MSRIGKKPILIPKGVEVKIEGQKITIRGPKSELSQEIGQDLKAEKKDDQILISLMEKGRQAKKNKASWGLARSLIANMVKGVTEGYEKKLQIIGVGYRANVEGKKLILLAGFSHPVEMEIPEGVAVNIEKDIIIISGSDKQLVGQFASRVRKVKPPEPYKGKGFRYINEFVRKKTGKKAVATE